MASHRGSEEPKDAFTMVKESVDHTSSRTCYRLRLLDGLIVIQAILSIILLGGIGWSHNARQGSGLPKPPRLVYSPLEDVVEYQIGHYTEATGENPVAHLPHSDKADTWKDLFITGTVQIAQEQALRLAEPTSLIPGDEDDYVISIEVFRQLHCLNMFSKLLHPENYVSPISPRQEVVDHCIDVVRQSLMCSIDINPLVWHWDEGRQEDRPNLQTAHTCRDFAKIERWVNAHRVTIGKTNATALGQDST